MDLADLVPTDRHPSAFDDRPLSLTVVSGMDALACHGIPERVPGINLSAHPLSPLEGYLVTLADGATSSDDIVAAAGLDAFDAAMAFQHLKQLGILRFRVEADNLASRRTLEGHVKPADEEKWVPAATPHVAKVGLQTVFAMPRPSDGMDENPLKLAVEARDRGDYQEARSRILQAWAIAPDSPAVNAMRAELEDPARAAARATALLNLAMAAHWGGNATFSLELCRRALGECELPDVHRQLAMVLLETRARRRDVEPHLRRLSELQPQDEWAPRMLHWILEQGLTPLPG
jgi:hypothetical protein